MWNVRRVRRATGGWGMKSVYLAGPIFGRSDEECMCWREIAKSVLGGKFCIVNPMNKDWRGSETVACLEIVATDLEAIDRSDFLLVNADSPSWGTAMEVFYAARAQKDVVAFSSDSKGISPWLRAHCVAVYSTLHDACDAILHMNVLKARR